MLGTTPANGTLHFDAKEFYIAFDEYVQVKDADNNILVSPPMKQKPEYSTKGRGIVVKIKDSLIENTTYLFQFKEGIVDFNEGNPLKSFEYVFSTGGSIDSMTIRGQVTDPTTLKPWAETVTVVAYAHDVLDSATLLPADSSVSLFSLCQSDSIVAKEHPMYMTRCDKEGRFELNHMRSGRYLLIAYEDADKNLRLGNDEAAAFLDTLVTAQKMPAPIDTATKDSTAATDSLAAKDSLAVSDTLSITDSTAALPDSIQAVDPIIPITLYISLHKQEKQRTTKAEFKQKGYIEIATQCPLSENYSIAPLGDSNGRGIYVKINSKRDSLSIWTAREDCDSIVLTLTDSTFRDTLKLHYREKMSAKKPIASITPPMLKKIVAASHPYYDTLWVGFAKPVLSMTYDSNLNADSLVTVFNLADSSTTHCGIILDSNLYPTGCDRARLDFVGKPGNKYQFTVPAQIIKNIYDQPNKDSLSFTTELTKPENYGNIILDIDVSRLSDTPADNTADDSTANRILRLPASIPQVLIQLTNEKGDVLQQYIVTENQRLSFLHLKGGKYGVRAVLDNDGDGKWTAGDYWRLRQPERIIFYEKTLELRENWDMEEKWSL